MRKVLFTILVVLPFSPGTSPQADTITLKDGDRLVGTLVDIRDGTISMRTSLAGKVFVPVDQVQGVTTTGFVIVTLDDRKLLPGHLRHRDGQVYVVHQASAEEQPIDLSHVTGVSTFLSAVEERPLESDREPVSPTEFSLKTGYRWRSGTEDYSGAFMELEARRVNDNSELSASVDVEYTDDMGAMDRFFGLNLRGRLGDRKGWNPELIFEVERNRDKALDFRGDLSVGVAKNFIESDRQTLEAGAGAGIAVERFDVGPLRRDQGLRFHGFWREAKKSREELNLNLSFRYTRIIFKKGVLEEGIEFRPSLSDLGDLRAYFESALSFPISPRIKLQLDLSIDYDDEVLYRGLDEWQTTVGASIGFKF